MSVPTACKRPLVAMTNALGADLRELAGHGRIEALGLE